MKQQKALLIEPPGDYIRMSRCMQKVSSRGGVYRFPLDLVKIGSYLKEALVDVKVLDLQAQSKESLVDALKNFKPDLAIISTGFPSMQYDANTAALVKKYSPETHVSMFGIPPTLMGEDFLDGANWGFDIHADSAIGADPVNKYLEMVKNGYESGFQKSSPHRNRDLILDRSLVDNKLYKSPVTGGLMTYVEASVGCPKKCSFCVIPYYFDGKYVHRNVQDVVQEIQIAVEKYGIDHVSIWDEGTTFSRRKTKELCEMIIDMKKNAPAGSKLSKFVRNTRTTTDLIDEEIVELFERSGLVSITMGIETFDPIALAQTGKGTTMEDNYRAIDLLSKSNIISIGHFVFGLPGDTKESAERTIKEVCKSKLDAAQFYCAIPYPGTEMYKLAKEQGWIEVDDLTQYELCNPIMGNENMSATDVGDLRKKAGRMFYMKKGIPLARKMLRHGNLKNVVQRGSSFAKRLLK